MPTKFWTEEKIQSLRDNYHRGAAYCAELFENKVTIGGIQTFACTNGISAKLGSDEHTKKTSDSKAEFNFRYFDQEPTPNMFFILGYTFADGNVFAKSGLRFRCSAKDDDILLGIKKELGSQKELVYYEQKCRSGYVSKMVKFQVGHQGCIETLDNRWQIFPAKGDLDCDFPLEYVGLYPGHYVRGFNAGDGSNGYDDGILFCGNFNYIDQLADYLSEKLDLSRPELSNSGRSYRVRWKRYEERMVLYQFMFPEGDYLYSRRKKLEIEVGLGIYPEGLKRFQVTVTKSCKSLRRYFRKCGCVVETVRYDRGYLILCTFSDGCVAGIEQFPTVRGITQL